MIFEQQLANAASYIAVENPSLALFPLLLARFQIAIQATAHGQYT